MVRTAPLNAEYDLLNSFLPAAKEILQLEMITALEQSCRIDRSFPSCEMLLALHLEALHYR
jgi:hypothetical protein